MTEKENNMCEKIEIHCHDPFLNQEWIEYECSECGESESFIHHESRAGFDECEACSNCHSVVS